MGVLVLVYLVCNMPNCCKYQFLALHEDSNEREFLLPDSFSRNQIRAVEGLLLDYDGLLVLEMDSGTNAIKVVKKED